MIIAVTGYRGYTDEAFIRGVLMKYNSGRMCSAFGPLHVRVGDATGADSFVRKWCRDNGVSHHVFRADWTSEGRMAGPTRNRRMMLGIGDPVNGETDVLVAFPRTDGKAITIPGSGTWGAVIKAAQMGIKVEIPPYRKSGD